MSIYSTRWTFAAVRPVEPLSLLGHVLRQPHPLCLRAVWRSACRVNIPFQGRGFEVSLQTRNIRLEHSKLKIQRGGFRGGLVFKALVSLNSRFESHKGEEEEEEEGLGSWSSWSKRSLSPHLLS